MTPLADVARAVATVADPELPGLTIADLGILREVVERDGRVVVVITPTFSGCPAMSTIQADVARVLAAAAPDAVVETRLSPPWSSSWITPDGRRKLAAAGIAPPADSTHVVCPHCGARPTDLLSSFGSTPCRALRRCPRCLEPFDAIKAI